MNVFITHFDLSIDVQQGDASPKAPTVGKHISM